MGCKCGNAGCVSKACLLFVIDVSAAVSVVGGLHTMTRAVVGKAERGHGELLSITS